MSISVDRVQCAHIACKALLHNCILLREERVGLPIGRARNGDKEDLSNVPNLVGVLNCL